MAGTLITLLPKTSFNLQQQSAWTSTIASSIDVSEYIDGVLIARIHSASTALVLTFSLFGDGYLENAGGTYFGTSIQMASVTFFQSVTPAPALVTVGGRLLGGNVQLLMTASGAGSGPPYLFDIGVDLCLRNPDSGMGPGTHQLGDLNSSGFSPNVLQPIFSKWGLDVSSVKFISTRLPDGISAQTLSDTVIALSPELLSHASTSEVLQHAAHELAHVVQIRELGWPAAATRATREEALLGSQGTRSISTALRTLSFEDLDLTDPRFPLEALSCRLGEIAGGIFE